MKNRIQGYLKVFEFFNLQYVIREEYEFIKKLQMLLVSLKRKLDVKMLFYYLLLNYHLSN